MRRQQPRSTTPRRAGSPAAAALLGALIAALLLLQTLGVVHAIVHRAAAAQAPLLRLAAPDAARLPSADKAATDGTATALSAQSGGWADTLFAGHDKGGSTCALYDQLVQPALPLDLSGSADPAFAPPLPAEPLHGGHIAPQAAGFLARGPPGAVA